MKIDTLTKIIVFFLSIITIEVLIIVLINKGLLLKPNSTQQNTNISSLSENLPIESGLLNSYLYFFEIRNQSVAKKTTILAEYEGVVTSVEFKKAESVLFYFKDFSGWFTLYKKPQLFKETNCSLYDKSSNSYKKYLFDTPPFEKDDQVDILYEFDFKNREISCKIKVIN